MFELKQTAKLASVNPRAEIHGEDRVAAFDLKIEATCPNDVLVYFHPELRTTLYKKADDPDLVDQIDGEALTALRLPKLGTLKWEQEFTGYKVEVDYGLGGDSNIVLGECKIDGFKIAPQKRRQRWPDLPCHLPSGDRRRWPPVRVHPARDRYHRHAAGADIAGRTVRRRQESSLTLSEPPRRKVRSLRNSCGALHLN